LLREPEAKAAGKRGDRVTSYELKAREKTVGQDLQDQQDFFSAFPGWESRRIQPASVPGSRVITGGLAELFPALVRRAGKILSIL
jgi:hypothetical protein